MFSVTMFHEGPYVPNVFSTMYLIAKLSVAASRAKHARGFSSRGAHIFPRF